MSGTIGFEDLRHDTVIQVAKMMAAAAITAPKSGGMMFLQGKPNFIETVIVDDRDTLHRLAEWMRARGKERREAIWFRDAEAADAIDAELEFVGPTCNLRDIDLGIAVGSASKTASIHSIDCRCQTRIAVAARKLDIIRADIAVGLSLSLGPKAVGFDRKVPEVDIDGLDYESTGTFPVGVPGGERQGGARNRQQPRTDLRSPRTDH